MTEEKALTKRAEMAIDAPAEWGSREEIAALGKRIKTMLPGGDKMSDAQAAAFAQYCKLTDVNPFRGESYGYVDWKGQLVIIDGYKAMTRWARQVCPYVEKYEPLDLTDDQAFGFRCWILRDDRKAELGEWVSLGAPWRDAFEMVAVFADGVVNKDELVIKGGKNAGNPASPPTGWTWEQVARKRALKNALNLSHGAPSPKEMAALSWESENGVKTIPADWDGTEELTTPHERQALAEMRAQERERITAWAQMNAQDQQAKAAANSKVLYGDPSFEGFDDLEPQTVDAATGEILDAPPPVGQAPPANSNARPFNAATVRDKVRQLAGWQNDQRWLDGEPLTDETDGLVANLLWAACKPAQGIASKDEMANRVTLIIRYLLGVDDVAQLYEKEAAAIIHWLANAEGTDLNNYANAEAAIVYAATQAEAGQDPLPM